MAKKIGGPRGRKPRIVTDGGHRVDDNRSPEEKAEAAAKERTDREEAEAIQLLSVVSRVKAKLVLVDAAAAKLKTEKDQLGDIFRAAKNVSKDFERGRIMELVTDSKPSERRNVQRNEEVRARFRRLMGLPVGLSDTERELEERLPEVERNSIFWRAAGYTAGLTGQFCEPPAECVGAGFDNVFAEGHKDGAAAYIANSKLAKAAAKQAASTPKAAPNPLDDPASPESLKANAESEKRARESLEAMGKGAGENAPAAAEGAAATTGASAASSGANGAGDGFEATPEELAKQAGRGKTAEEIAGAEGGEAV